MLFRILKSNIHTHKQKDLKSRLLKNIFIYFGFLNLNCNILAEETLSSEWVKSFGGSKSDYFSSVIETSDNGLVAVGRTLSIDIAGLANLSTTGYYDAIIVKYDKEGNQAWVKNFGGSRDDYFASVVETNNGDLVAVGYTYSTNIEGLTNLSTTSYYDAIIVKYDSKGEYIWANNFGGSGNESFYSIIETKNGELLISGYSNSTDIKEFSNLGNADAIIIKYDNQGNKVWAKNFGGSAGDYFRSIIEANNGEIIAVGESYSTDIKEFSNLGGSDAIIVRYDIKYILSLKSASDLVEVYVIPNNALKVSLNTNSITFDNFSYTESVEKLNALELVVSSTLPYNIKVSIENDIIGTTYGENVDKSIFNIKSSSSSSYQSFSDSNTSLILLQNQSAGNDMAHSIDMKLSSKKMNKVDVYKAVLKFEVEQV
jgi:hypothetical protein